MTSSIYPHDFSDDELLEERNRLTSTLDYPEQVDAEIRWRTARRQETSRTRLDRALLIATFVIALSAVINVIHSILNPPCTILL